MPVHHLVALAFQAIVPLAASTDASSAVKVGYSDVANKYVSLKYSNGYLKFGDDVQGKVDLRAEKLQGIYSNHKTSNFFKKVKGSNNDTGQGLVLFCKKMKDRVESGKDLTNRQLKYVGGCDRDSSIPKSKDMNARSYGMDQLARTQYKSEDFGFGDKLSEQTGERVTKFHDLMKLGYTGSLEEVLRKAKSECQVIRDKFGSKDKLLTEEDLKTHIPRCASSLRIR